MAGAGRRRVRGDSLGWASTAPRLRHDADWIGWEVSQGWSLVVIALLLALSLAYAAWKGPQPEQPPTGSDEA